MAGQNRTCPASEELSICQTDWHSVRSQSTTNLKRAERQQSRASKTGSRQVCVVCCCCCLFVSWGGGGLLLLLGCCGFVCVCVCVCVFQNRCSQRLRNAVIAELATDSVEVELTAEHCLLSSSARQWLVTATKLRGQSVRPVQWLPAAVHVQCLHVRSSSDSVLRTLLMTDRCLTVLLTLLMTDRYLWQ